MKRDDNILPVRVKRLHPDATLPKYATDGSACFDLHACPAGWTINALAYGVTVTPGCPLTFRTGLAFELPPGYGLFIFSRSGHGFKSRTRLSNCVGVVDADYRAEVLVQLTADAGGALLVNPHDRIAQACVLPVPRVKFYEVHELTETARGAGGFGSTGA